MTDVRLIQIFWDILIVLTKKETWPAHLRGGGVHYYNLEPPSPSEEGGGLEVPWGSPLEFMMLYQNMQKR